jgi:hypothetical protein
MTPIQQEYRWVEEFLLRELPKYELKRDPTMSQADCLELFIPKANKSRVDFLSGMFVVVMIWIMVAVAQKAGL